MRFLGRDWWVVIVYGLLLALGVVVIVAGARRFNAQADADLLAAGIVCLTIVAAAMPIAIGQGRPTPGAAGDLEREQVNLLREIREHTLLSDSAKRIAYRRDEREMLRRAIEEDIAQEDWDAAMSLVNDMGDRFGYREEAEEFRRRIEQARHEYVETKVNESLAAFEDMLSNAQWQAAYTEAGRIGRLYPDSHRVQGLEQRVRQAWEDHKHALERRFLDAARRGDVDEAMELLRTLDAYLTPREAEPFREVARGVISKAKQNLGLQFKLAVQDHDWPTAVRVGETIIREFPNTLMAREVRERIDVLRTRAAEAGGLSRGPVIHTTNSNADHRRPPTPTVQQVGEREPS